MTFQSMSVSDGVDLLMFLGNWTGALEPGIGQEMYKNGDSDADGDVDSADMLVFLSQWTGAAATTDASRVTRVPERGCLGLAGLSLALIRGRERRRS